MVEAIRYILIKFLPGSLDLENKTVYFKKIVKLDPSDNKVNQSIKKFDEKQSNI